MVKENINHSVTPSGIILPFARLTIRGVGWLFSLSLLIVIILTEVSITTALIFILFTIISMMAIYFVTHRKRLYYFPIVFILFYLIGYMMSLQYILLTKNNLDVTGWVPVGTFHFTDIEWLRLFFVILFGLAGLMSAVALFEAFRKQKKSNLRIADRLFTKNRATLWITLWVFLSAIIIFIMAVLGIGKHGLAEQLVLPFKLTGILLYVRNFIIPFCGFMLIDIFTMNGQQKFRNITILLLLGMAVTNSVLFFSKMQFAIPLTAISLYFFLNAVKSKITIKNVILYALMLPLCFALIMQIVTEVREAIYMNDIVAISSITNFSVSESISFIFQLIILRIEGIRLLMAIDSSSLSGLQFVWAWFTADPLICDIILTHIFGFVPSSAFADTAFGLTLGTWGFLYLSKSYFIVFVGTLIYTIFILSIEELFKRRGLVTSTLFFAVNIGFFIWMNLTWFFLIRIAAMVMLAYFLVRLIERQYVKKPKRQFKTIFTSIDRA